MKICSRCFIKKSMDQFYKNSHSKDGYVNFCKSCKAGYDIARYTKTAFNAKLLRGWGRCEIL